MTDGSPAGAQADGRAGERLGAAARWAPLGLAAAVLLAADQITKALAFDRLCEQPDGAACLLHAEPVEVVWTLQWNLAFNTGMAFSRGANAGPIIGIVVLVIVAVLLFVARKVRSRLQLVLIGVVVGGALGNLVDRLLRAEDGFLSGAVVDFIDVQWWPIFNIADAAVVVGGLALALTGFTTEPGPDGRGPAEAGSTGAGSTEAGSTGAGSTEATHVDPA